MQFTEKTLNNWKAYEKVRQGGQYNMIMDFEKASKAAGLSINTYTSTLRQYSAIRDYIIKEYGSVEAFMAK